MRTFAQHPQSKLVPPLVSVTIVHIAHRLQVSPTTVSRALKDDPRITIEVRDKVKHIAKQLGYRPNLLARGLVNSKTHSIGYVVDNLSWSYFSELAECVQAIAEHFHYSSYIHSSLKQPQNEKQGIEGLLSRGVDGVLISPTEAEENFPIFQDLVRRRFPVVMLSALDQIGAASVTIDNRFGALMVMQHFYDLGHRTIMYIGPRENSTVKTNRLSGYHAFLRAKNLKSSANLVFCDEDSPMYGYQVVQKVIRSRRPPSAIFAHNDTLALGVYRGIYEMGLKIPQDVSVIGFDDLPSCGFVFPPLSSVGLPLTELARSAVELLMQQINQPTPAQSRRKPKRIVLEPRLVIRGSTATPRRRSSASR